MARQSVRVRLSNYKRPDDYCTVLYFLIVKKKIIQNLTFSLAKGEMGW